MSVSKFKTTLGTGVVLAVLALMPGAQAASYVGNGTQDWRGFYAGIHTGVLWSDFSGHSATTAGPSGSDSSLLIGAQAGYNWQWDRIVAGGEADFSSTGTRGSDGVGRLEENWSSTLRGRAGYAFGKILPYGTFGLGLTNTDSEVGTGSINNTHVGYALGLGVDYALMNNLSARLEYLHVDVPEESDTVAGQAFNGGAGNNFLRIGANYRF